MDFVLSELHEHILRLEVGVNDSADSMQVIKADQHLDGDFPADGQRDPFVLISLYYFKQVHS